MRRFGIVVASSGGAGVTCYLGQALAGKAGDSLSPREAMGRRYDSVFFF